MARDPWHIDRDGPVLTLSRARPVRFDLAAQTRFAVPDLIRARLAHQIRQDMWRRLQTLRGFRPAVRVTRVAGGLEVIAGGAVDGPVSPATRAALAGLLDDPALRARWVRCARTRPGKAPAR